MKERHRALNNLSETEKDAMILGIWNTLYPDGDMDHEWSSDELDVIASIFRYYELEETDMKNRLHTPGPVMMYGIGEPPPDHEIETETSTNITLNTETKELTIVRSLYEIVEGKGSSVGGSDEDIISEVKWFLEHYVELKEEVQNLAGHLHILYLTMKDLDNTDASDEEKFNALRDFIEKRVSSPNADIRRAQESLDQMTATIGDIYTQLNGGSHTLLTSNMVEYIKREIENRQKEAYLQSRQVEKLRIEAETNKQILLGIVGSVRGKPFAGDSDSLTMDEVIDLLNAEIANKNDDLDDDNMYDVLGLRDTLRTIYENLTQNNGDELTDAQLDDRISRRIRALRFERDQIGLDYRGPATDPPSPFNQLKSSLDHWCVLAIEREARLKTMSKQLRIVAKSLPGDIKASLDPIADIGDQHDD